MTMTDIASEALAKCYRLIKEGITVPYIEMMCKKYRRIVTRWPNARRPDDM